MTRESRGPMKRRGVVMPVLAKTDIAHRRVVMGIFVDGEQLLDIREQGATVLVRVCDLSQAHG